ncbi:dihydrodipicolinate synthetase family protein [Metarhizium album ARSEF 1941]|uniref:Dihydrodipicolinate synthetase family protein n=1 Tax=Metarhizium album (strain ARSEF 1941) TaxID=1081103 RepID=A0A0B2WNP0_METAS|nr:dihydrodipicolinate synthetase family protein [Metarhizium album ARSEF 1941]KHN95239.1 dihydrodipicolinate synthetase family protein [Metarhizium album ARSEF 1941]
MPVRQAASVTAPGVPPAGVWCPAVTCFTDDDDLDLEAQAKYFAHLSRSGLAGLVVMGTNSEAMLLTREERSQLIATARRAVGPAFPLMAGVGAHSTKQTLQLADDAAEAGADYLLVLPPAYFGKATTMATTRRFFAAVAAAAALPVVIYNFPGVCNGVDLDSDTITAIVRDSAARNHGVSRVVGVKLTCGSVGKITRLAAQHRPDAFSIFGGQSDFLVGGLAAGSAGCIAAFANVCPRLTAEIYRLYTEGLRQRATELQQLAALAESPCKAGIAATKFAATLVSARLAGIDDAEAKFRPRHPYEEPSDAAKRSARAAIREAADMEEVLQKAAA